MNSLETRLRREEELDKIRAALDEGSITRKEYEAILAHDYGITEEQTARWPIVAAAMVILGVFGLFAMWGGTITGLVVYPTETAFAGGAYENNTLIALNTTNTTTIQVSGLLENGSATIYAQSNNQTLLVWSGTTRNNTIWLEKSQYSVNESIVLETELTNYSLWVVDEQDNRTPITNNFTMNSGNYTLEVLADKKYEIDFSVGDESIKRVTRTEFVEGCEETCEVAGLSNVSLAITMSEGARIELSEIIVTVPSENTAPEQISDIPTVTVNETATIDLGNYFNDTDDLTYEINNIIGVEETIVGSNLTLTSNNPGEYTATLYVSDLKAVTTANFDIIVVGEIVENTTNQTNETVNVSETMNETVNETISNTTTNETTEITTNDTVQPTSQPSCDNPNVNLRPPECFGDQFDLAFEEVEAPLRNNNLEKVARVTRFGNFIISGQYVENSNEEPEEEDFTVGYTTADGFLQEYQATAWIDTDTGNLHLRGNLYQEQGTIQAPQYDSFVISNPNGIILAYFDERTGDLYLKGNIVQLGRP